MVIMYSVTAKALSELTDEDSDIEDIIEIFIDCEILDESGANSYSPEKTQTSKLTPVRVNRLITFICS